MPTFLFKTEPGEYSFQQLQADKKTTWTGVSNAAALGHLRTARKGDQVFIYHTGDEKAIVGLAKILTAPYADPAAPGLNSRGEIATPVVDLAPVKTSKTPLTLAKIKADKRFDDFALVKQSRLSIMPVPDELAQILRDLTGL